MKAFNLTFLLVLIMLAAIFTGADLFVLNAENSNGREYRVQIERASNDIAKTGRFNLSDYPLIIGAEKQANPDDTLFLSGGNSDYLIREINGELYRFDYRTDNRSNKRYIILIVNTAMGIMSFVIIAVLVFIKIRLLKPFNKIEEMPYELSKGNLVTPLKEGNGKYFGKFVWGMDLLRERLEQQKAEELRLQKEKKTLILSLTHDIKTPLSAIKLYSKALSKNLYTDKEKQLEIAENINARADDIEAYIAEIVKASKEDFLNLQVTNGEFYLSEAVTAVAAYYADKLSYLKIDMELAPYTNCLLNGDKERAVEVLQNLIENAVKYGGGTPIKIRFTDEEGCRLIFVENGGCTLSDNETPHIFDSFWRGSNSENTGGSGLGLYICRQLMHKMNGEIFARKCGETMTVAAVFKKA